MNASEVLPNHPASMGFVKSVPTNSLDYAMRTNGRKRLSIILAVGVFLILVSGFYLHYFLARPVGSGPAGPRVEASQYTQPWTTRLIKVVGIGDSITAGLGADSPDHSFFNRLLRNPDDEFAEMQGVCLSAVIPNLEYENLAMSGSTSEQHLNVVQERLSAVQAEDCLCIYKDSLKLIRDLS